MFQENKARQIFQKTNISYPLIRTRTCVYQGLRNVRFSENLTCFAFLNHPLWDSLFCLTTDEILVFWNQTIRRIVFTGTSRIHKSFVLFSIYQIEWSHLLHVIDWFYLSTNIPCTCDRPVFTFQQIYRVWFSGLLVFFVNVWVEHFTIRVFHSIFTNVVIAISHLISLEEKKSPENNVE